MLHVARLARLRLDAAEVETLTRDLNGILSHVAALEGVDLSRPPAVVVATGGGAPLRTDLPGADPLNLTPGELAPEWVDGFFTVPRLAALDAGPAEAEGGS